MHYAVNLVGKWMWEVGRGGVGRGGEGEMGRGGGGERGKKKMWAKKEGVGMLARC